MEVRCGSCNKLFRVSDDQITGSGIKFPCTRCHEYVKITREDFEHYTMSQSAVSVLDLFEPKPRPAPPLTPDTAQPASADAMSPAPSMPLDSAAQSSQPDILEIEFPSVGPEPVDSAPAVASEPAAAREPEPSMPLKSEPTGEERHEPEPEALIPLAAKSEPPAETQPESLPISMAQLRAEASSKDERGPGPDKPAAPTTSPSRSEMPPKEISRPSAPSLSRPVERSVIGIQPPSTLSRLTRVLMVLFITLIIASLAAYGMYLYRQRSSIVERVTAPVINLTEGLQIFNPQGSIQPNGDLLITGILENAMEKERNAWYVVAEVYDAQGGVLSRIRLFNGKQIYSRGDYDIMAGRGVNVQELKAKTLQDKDIVIPPKGSINFEMRYFQPPAGIASFNTRVLPFDPDQLNKEMAGEAQ